MTEEARPAEDILGRAVRLRLGGVDYVLRVLSIAGNERWREHERRATEGAVAELEAAGKSTAEILAAFARQPDTQLDLLYAYDTDCGTREGVLPPVAELREQIDEFELDTAIREVVKAANPKAIAIIETARKMAALSALANASLASSSSPSKSGAKHQMKSAQN